MNRHVQYKNDWTRRKRYLGYLHLVPTKFLYVCFFIQMPRTFYTIYIKHKMIMTLVIRYTYDMRSL